MFWDFFFEVGAKIEGKQQFSQTVALKWRSSAIKKTQRHTITLGSATGDR